MQSSNLPARVPLAFATDGPKNIIPLASQIAIKPAIASLTDGFPPITMLPDNAGGLAPFGEDFNGILFLLSAQIVWACAGGPMTFDVGFAEAVGGYPKGANLASNTAPGRRWTSVIENNANDPDAGGAGWIVGAQPPTAREVYSQPGTVEWVCPPGVYQLEPRLVGPGGAGSNGAPPNPGHGGGGGGYCSGPVYVVPGNIYPLSVGLFGGVGVPGSPTSAFGLIANDGGNGSAGGPGAGGTATGGLINRQGGGGGYGYMGGTTAFGGGGGASPTLYGPNPSVNSPGPATPGQPGSTGQGGTGGPNGSGGNGGGGEIVLCY